jgi:hypothetical protein
MRISLLCTLVLVLTSATSDGREWTDSTGQKKVEAEYAYVEDGFVYLRLPSGELRACKPERLSDADQEYVQYLEVIAKNLTLEARAAASFNESENHSRSLPLIEVAAKTVQIVADTKTADTANVQQDQEDAAGDDYRRVFKRIYCGCDITAHLIRRIGTVAWCHHGQLHLDQLYYWGTTGGYLWYRVVGQPNVWWAFGTVPDHCGQYHVWRISPHHHPLLFCAHIKYPW